MWECVLSDPPFHFISEETRPIECSDKNLTFALGPSTYLLTQDVLDTFIAPRIVLVPAEGVRGEVQALVEDTKKKIPFFALEELVGWVSLPKE